MVNSIWYLPFWCSYYYVTIDTGICVQLASGETRMVKCALLLCSVDLTAKAAVCNMLNFNGLSSCPTCLDRGDNSVTSVAMHRVWPFEASSVIRDQQMVLSAVKKAVEEDVVVSTIINVHLSL